jgi:phospholipid/cholesterol/gamma-HCH transport system substrate-binding protein
MPERAKVQWSQLKIGVVALTAFVLIFVLVFLLTSEQGIFRRYIPLYTYLSDAAGMANGTPVRLNGISVGYLNGLSLTNSSDRNRAVRFEMMVQKKYLADIPVDSVATIAAANLLGDKFINITRGQDRRTVQAGAELRGVEGQDIPELMAQSANLLQTFQTIVKRVDNLLAGVEAGKGNIGLLLKDDTLYRRLNGIAAEGQALLADVRNGHGTLSKLIYSDEFYNELRSPIRRIDGMLADMQAGQGTAGKLLKDPALYDELHQTVQQIHTLVADANSGKGTLGKLLTSDELHQRLNDLLAKLNTTVDKINSGQGTVGQLMVNPQLYESMNGATREFQSLAKDIRANPKKFLTLRLALF